MYLNIFLPRPFNKPFTYAINLPKDDDARAMDYTNSTDCDNLKDVRNLSDARNLGHNANLELGLPFADCPAKMDKIDNSDVNTSSANNISNISNISNVSNISNIGIKHGNYKGYIAKVPFAGKSEWGLITEEASRRLAFDVKKLKPIEAIFPIRLFADDFLEFLQKASQYNASPLGSFLSLCLPNNKLLNESFAKITAVQQQDDANKPTNNSQTDFLPPNLNLNEQQQNATDKLAKMLDKGGFASMLIHGITGSGKTEVYMEGIKKIINRGKQALVMLPEIILTDQFITRFTETFGFKPTIWHSSITPAKRKDAFIKIITGEAKLILGARSALFLPYVNLGIIIVDEEHEPSYKQEEGVIYHARNMAVLRGKYQKMPIILASASPSVETYHNVELGKYHIARLTKRYKKAVLPEIQLIDMRAEKLSANCWISYPLRQELISKFAKKEQSLLFLNRRGYAPLTLCRACGHRIECSNCSAYMNAHKSPPHLKCHQCGEVMEIPLKCPECGAEGQMAFSGPGAERLEEEVYDIFKNDASTATLPKPRVMLITSDKVNSAKKAEEAVQLITRGEVDIIIGTQMIAKGHNFPNLTLVGIVQAEMGADSGDFRIYEKTFQILKQVAGRAGRREKKGKALVQTFNPGSPAINAIKTADDESFYQTELAARKFANCPPYRRMLAIIVSGKKEEMVKHTSEELANIIRDIIASNIRMVGRMKQEERSQKGGGIGRIEQEGQQKQASARKESEVESTYFGGIRFFGAIPAQIYQIRKEYRYRLLLSSPLKADLQNLVKHAIECIKIPSYIKIKIDVDPMNFL